MTDNVSYATRIKQLTALSINRTLYNQSIDSWVQLTFSDTAKYPGLLNRVLTTNHPVCRFEKGLESRTRPVNQGEIRENNKRSSAEPLTPAKHKSVDLFLITSSNIEVNFN